MKKLLIIILLLSHLQIDAQKIGENEVFEDLTFLKESIKNYNPALPYYHPEFDSLATQVIKNADIDSVSEFVHFTNVSRICALANEGHFKVGDRNDVFRKGILENTHPYLPIQVKIISGHVFVLGDFSNEQLLNRGDEVIAINGIRNELILNNLLELTPSDGDILTYAYRKIEDGFASMYHFYIQQTDTFNITLRTKNYKEKIVRITALVRSDQLDNIKKYYPRNKTKTPDTEGFYTLDINDNYAYLKLSSFDFRKVNKFNVKSNKLYKNIFKELKDKNVNNLVIDLRDNTGGRNEFADGIVPFINKKYENGSYLKKTISWDGKMKTYKLPKPSKLVFKGSIYVLVNEKTYSAGSSLARFLKEYGNATIIGTETGTRYEGFAGGSEENIILPHSKIEIGIPRYHIVYPKSEKQETINRGLLPDYEIDQTFEAYISGQDLHLKKVISLIDQE